MGHRNMETRKVIKKPSGDLNVRRSNRIQAKPNPALVAAKKMAQQKMGGKKQASFSFVSDIYQIARDSKNTTILPSGIVYDNKMMEHKCLWDENYPESPARLQRSLQRCAELGYLQRCQTIESRMATEKEISELHGSVILSLLKSTQDCNDIDHLESLSAKYDAVYIHPSTYECSLLAAGSVTNLIDGILNKKVQNGMAFVRPPGHHAMKDEYCGYCFFNNVALAANHALNSGINKILIVDWDVHHGQGTQQLFYEDPRVLYFSIHRYEHGTFWPNLRESEFDYIGEGPGRGFNINVPLNVTGLNDRDYLAIFHHILLRVAYEFQPELVIVSAGYDAALGCPEGEMKLTPAVYAHLTRSLMSLANGKVAVVLEGGYCLKSLAESAAMTLSALLGDPCPSVDCTEPTSPSVQNTILNTIYVLRNYWKCLQSTNVFSIHEAPSENEERYIPSIKYKHTESKPDKYETRNCYPVQSLNEMSDLENQLNLIISNTKLLKPLHKVCFVYDVKMMDHINVDDKNHIERPERISAIFNMHNEYNLLQRLHMLSGRLATEEELLSAHSNALVKEVQSFENLSMKELKEKKNVYFSVYLHTETYKAACLAAGSLLQVVDSVLSGESGSGVAVIRPPGHHADIDEPCGFCIFNSVSIGAKYAINKYQLKRVLIVDWDVHHGNGTQEIFYEDANVLYISVHRFDNGEFFPGSGDGGESHVGRGAGEGFNVNIPWNKGGMGNAEYVAAFFQIVLPIAYQYNPELVLISAGFDAAEGDPLGGCKVSPEAFGHMTHWLSGLANGRVIVCLEGGYNVNSISYSMTMCTKALLGDPIPSLKEGLTPCRSALDTFHNVISVQKNLWPCLLNLSRSLPAEDVLTNNNNNNNHHQKNESALSKARQMMRGLSLSDSDTEPQEGDSRGEENKEGSKSGDGGGGGGASQSDSQQPSSSSSSQQNTTQNQTLTDYLLSNINALAEERMFAVVPLKTCPHLPEVNPVPPTGIDAQVPCQECSESSENWVCLTCYSVKCGRYINEHMLMHSLEESHPLTLSFSDLSVWCYACQAYIDNEALYAAKNAVHMSKFGEQLTWSYNR